jgi:hypothetical protein
MEAIMSGGGSDAADDMNKKLDEQQRIADADKESHRKSLERMRMEVIKSVGGQQWQNPDAPDAGSDNGTDLSQQ